MSQAPYTVEYHDIGTSDGRIYKIGVLCDSDRRLISGAGAWTVEDAEQKLGAAVYHALRDGYAEPDLARVPAEIRAHTDLILNHPERAHVKARILARFAA